MQRRNEEGRSQLLSRVRGEFAEMPGLRLTLAQATRLWALRADICQRLLAELELQGILMRVAGNAYCRRDR